MFKRFDPSNDCSTSSQVKTSVQRAIKTSICESHPNVDPDDLDELLPKKTPLTQFKVGPHALLYCLPGGTPVFFQSRDGPILPCLKLVHTYPDLGWTSVTVDQGAIPFVLGGANIMCPGLTNEGASMQDRLQSGEGVVIMAEGKENALAVGVMKLNSEVVRKKNKGVGVEVSHFMGDGLFNAGEIS